MRCACDRLLLMSNDLTNGDVCKIDDGEWNDERNTCCTASSGMLSCCFFFLVKHVVAFMTLTNCEVLLARLVLGGLDIVDYGAVNDALPGPSSTRGARRGGGHRSSSTL